MSDWYSRAREEDGRTDDEIIAEIRRPEYVLGDEYIARSDRCKTCNHPWNWHRKWLADGGHETDSGSCSCREFIVKGSPADRR